VQTSESSSSVVSTERLHQAATAQQRLYYATVVTSLLSAYLALDNARLSQLFPVTGTDITEAVIEDLSAVEPLLELSDYMIAHPEIVQAYRDFLGPLIAIEDAAERIVLAMPDADPRWLSVDPADRQLVRDASASLQGQLVFTLDFYDSDNLRALPLENIEFFVNTFVAPEAHLDNARTLRQLQAAARVSGIFGMMGLAPATWPTSLRFTDFVIAREETEVKRLVERARAQSGIAATTERLIAFCEANKIEDSSPNGITRALSSGSLLLAPDAGAERIEISFLPTGIERRLLIALAPVVTLLLYLIYLSHEARYRATLRAMVKTTDGSPAELLEAGWLRTNLRFLRIHERGLGGQLLYVGLAVAYAGGEAILLVSQVLCLSYLRGRQVGVGMTTAYSVAVVCSVVTGLILTGRAGLILAPKAKEIARRLRR
jgi:hypothetical protein